MNIAASGIASDERVNSTIALLAVGAIAVSLSTNAPIISMGLGVLTVCLIVWINWGKPWRRKRRMRHPFTAFFGESDRGKWTHQLIVPANSEVDIQIRVEPKLHYIQHEIMFGFEGEDGQRPEPVRTKNAFVKVGKSKYQDPLEERTHYIDVKDAYHIQSTHERTYGNTYALGFLVKTHGPGRYPVRLLVMSDSGESLPRKPLVLIVEERISKPS
jgi:hypothetical protein